MATYVKTVTKIGTEANDYFFFAGTASKNSPYVFDGLGGIDKFEMDVKVSSGGAGTLSEIYIAQIAALNDALNARDTFIQQTNAGATSVNFTLNGYNLTLKSVEIMELNRYFDGSFQGKISVSSNVADTLLTSNKSDLLTGRGGADIFKIGANDAGANDLITDFSSAEGDKIDLTAYTDIVGIAQLNIQYDAANNTLQLDLNNDNTADLMLANVSSVSQSDFIMNQITVDPLWS